MMPYTVSNADLTPTIDSSTVGAWNMRQEWAGTVEDLSGRGNHLTLAKSPLQCNNIMGDYLAFNGINQYGSGVASGAYASNFTLSMWVRMNSAANSVFFTEGNSSNVNPFWYLGTLGSKFRWMVRDDTGLVSIGFDSTTAFVVGQLYHCVVVKTGTSVTLYVNAVANTPISIASIVTVTLNNLTIGAFGRTGVSDYSNADVYSTTIYNEAKAAAWIAKEYARGKKALWRSEAVDTTGTITSGFIGDSPFKVDSGSFKIRKDVIKNTTKLGNTILRDGDMEAATVVDWTPSSTALLTKSVVSPYAGTQSLRHSYNGVSGRGEFYLSAGKKYRLTGWARPDGLGTAPRLYTNSPNTLIWTGTTTGVYQPIDITFDTYGGQTQLWTWLLNASTTDGWCQWDNMTVQEVLPDATVIEWLADSRCSVPTSIMRNNSLEASYGEWIFYVYSTNLGATYIQFVSLDSAFSSTGYSLTLTSSGLIQFRRSDGVSFTTIVNSAIGVIPSNAYSKIRITRNSVGVFNVYVNDTLVITGTDTTYNVSNTITIRSTVTGTKLALGSPSGDFSIVKRLLP